jgi:tetratricopeptide (TPR) repeat protein
MEGILDSKNFGILQISILLLLILAVTFLAIVLIRKIPYLSVGWFWYLGTLVPVIGLIQVGSQAMADRYAYVPLIGIFMIIAWGVPQLLSRLPYGKIIAASAAFIFVGLITLATYSQVSIWKNDLTLFGHVIALNPNNTDAYQVIGCAMANNGESEKALYYYYMALKYNPRCDKSYVNAGIILQKMGKSNEAINCYKKALQINNKSAEADYNLGIALIEKNLLNEAVFYFKNALEITPDDYDTHNNLGVALIKKGNIQEALAHFQVALRLNPHRVEAKKNMSIAIIMQKKDIRKNSSD